MIQQLKRLWSFLETRRKRQFVVLCMLAVLGAFAEVSSLAAVYPFLTFMANPESEAATKASGLVEHYLGLSDEHSLLFFAGTFAALAMIAAAVRLLVIYFTNRFVYGVGHDLSVTVFRLSLSQPYDWHMKRNSSESLAAPIKAQMATSGGLMPLIQGGVALVVATAIISTLLMIDATSALYGAGGFAGCYLVISAAVRPRLRKNSQIISRTQHTRLKVVQEGIGAIRDVILDGSRELVVRRYSDEDAALREAQSHNAVLGQSPRFALEGIALTLIAFLAWKLASGNTGLSSFLPTLGALALGGQKLIPLFQQMYAGWAKLTSSHAIITDVVNLLSLPPSNEPVADEEIEFSRSIRLSDVGFNYGEPHSKVLDGVWLEVKKGERIGVVGETGCGKSTLMDIVMGLLSPTSGSFEVDGVPISAGNRHKWRARIAHVPQDVFLIDSSIEENIVFGRAQGTEARKLLDEAAYRARIAPFIQSLPDGYGTVVGERGVRLSGGQKQRLGIARALYKSADVLVLDEATSALDEGTEREVIAQIENLPRLMTIFVVAHRVTTLRGCDRVLRLRHGRIVEEGSFEHVATGHSAEPAHRM